MLGITLDCLSLKAAHHNYLNALSCTSAHFTSPLLALLFRNRCNPLRSRSRCDFLAAVIKLSTNSIFCKYYTKLVSLAILVRHFHIAKILQCSQLTEIHKKKRLWLENQKGSNKKKFFKKRSKRSVKYSIEVSECRIKQ